ncbi:hypothetical protein EJ06DRAFT_525283 [Trichodelitschia bisporula]|uniref:Uncharacterized protein n=1 Tax=Trichodelitschia bisporula TaxID=703511 RepID=A0A6G1HII8_9PEZI|nr:hypothetical protein EJ06DRAFT_525283 [Trichodelitschia bisporula]
MADTMAAEQKPSTDDKPVLNNPFQEDLSKVSGSEDMGQVDTTEPSSPPVGNKAGRASKEWDASKVPPSQFQKRKGSIFATPSSRDGHVKGSERDKAFHEKVKEKASKSWTSIFSKK